MITLSYLFECHFTDGTHIAQTPEDISTIDSTRSAFYDVVQRLNEVVIFGLLNDDNTYVVDLRDGHFEINGIPFDCNMDDIPEGDFERRLVYFRRHAHSTTNGEEDHAIAYHFGWQATIDGKNYQRTISIN